MKGALPSHPAAILEGMERRMSVAETRGGSVLLQAVLQTGPLCYLVAFAFKLGIVQSALAGMSAVEAAVLHVAAAGLGALGCMAAARLWPRGGCRLVAAFAFAVPLGLLVASLLLGTAAALCVSLGLAAVSLAQFFLVVRSNPLDFSDTLLASSLAFGFSGTLSVLIHGAPALFGLGMGSLALLLASTGALMGWQALRNPAELPHEGAAYEEASTGETETTHRGKGENSPLLVLFSSSVRSAAPVLLVCLACSMSLGGSWGLNPFYDARAEPGPFFVGSMAAVAMLLSLRIAWMRMRSADALLIASALPLSMAIVLTACYAVAPSPFEYAMAAMSEFCFLSIIWACALLLDRSSRSPGFAGTLLLVYFLALFALFTFLGSLMSLRVARAAVALAACFGLVYLIFFAYRAQRTEGIVDIGPDVENAQAAEGIVSGTREIIDARCTALSVRYGLSAREAELLPFFASAMSAAAIGERLFISPKTVNSHRYRIYAKLGVATKDELMALVWERD